MGTATAYAGGDGSSSNPYQIDNCSQLQDAGTNLSSNFELISDIDCSTHGYFEPIGGAGDGDNFTATFNGNGYAVKNVEVQKATDNLGLFGEIDDTAVVENLMVRNISVTYNGSSLNSNYGGLVGRTSSGTLVRDVTVTGKVNATYSNGFVGGIAGLSRGDTTRALAQVDVYGDSNTAGLIGANRGLVQNSVSVTSSVEAPDYASVAGFIGSGVAGEVQDSYWDNQTLSSQTEGVGEDGTGSPTAINYTVDMIGSSASSTLSALDFTNNWREVTATESDTGEDEYPILQALNDTEQIEAMTVSYNTVNVDIQNEDRADIPNNENFYLDTSGGANYGFTIGTSLGVVDEANFTAEYDNGTVMYEVEKTNYDTDGIEYINIGFDESVSTANLTASIKDEDGVGSEEITVDTYFPSFTSTLNSPDIQNGNVTVAEGEDIDGNASVTMSNYGTGSANMVWGAEDYSLAFSQTIDDGQFSSSNFITNATSLIPSSEITDGEQFNIDLNANFGGESDTFTLFNKHFEVNENSAPQKSDAYFSWDFLGEHRTVFEIYTNTENDIESYSPTISEVDVFSNNTIRAIVGQQNSFEWTGVQAKDFGGLTTSSHDYNFTKNVGTPYENKSHQATGDTQYVSIRLNVTNNAPDNLKVYGDEISDSIYNVQIPENIKQRIYADTGADTISQGQTESDINTWEVDSVTEKATDNYFQGSQISIVDNDLEEQEIRRENFAYNNGSTDLSDVNVNYPTIPGTHTSVFGETATFVDLNAGKNKTRDTYAYGDYVNESYSNSTVQDTSQQSTPSTQYLTGKTEITMVNERDKVNFTLNVSSTCTNVSSVSLGEGATKTFSCETGTFTNDNLDYQSQNFMAGDKSGGNTLDTQKVLRSGMQLRNEYSNPEIAFTDINVSVTGDDTDNDGQIEQIGGYTGGSGISGGTCTANCQKQRLVDVPAGQIYFFNEPEYEGDWVNETFISTDNVTQDEAFTSDFNTQYIKRQSVVELENTIQLDWGGQYSDEAEEINVSSTCSLSDTVVVGSGSTVNASCNMNQETVSQIQVTDTTVDNLSQNTNQQSTVSSQVLNVVKSAEVQNNLNTSLQNVDTGSTCGSKGQVNLSAGANSISGCNDTTETVDYVDSSNNEFAPVTQEDLSIDAGYTGERNISVENTNSSLNFTDIDTSTDIQKPYAGCSVTNSPTVDLNAGENKTASAELQCPVGETSNLEQISSGDSKSFRKNITIYSDETKENALTFEVNKSELVDYSERTDGSEVVEVDGKTHENITTTETNSTIYVTIPDTFGNSSLEAGSHEAVYTYEVSTSDGGLGGGGDDEPTGEVTFSKNALGSVQPGSTAIRSFTVQNKVQASNRISFRVPTNSEEQECSVFRMADEDGKYVRTPSHTVGEDEAENIDVQVEIPEDAERGTTYTCDIATDSSKGEIDSLTLQATVPQQGLLNAITGSFAIDSSLNFLGDTDVGERVEQGGTTFLVFISFVTVAGIVMIARARGRRPIEELSGKIRG